MKKEVFAEFYVKYRLFIFPSIVVFSSLILIIFVIFPQITSLLINQKVQGDLNKKSKFLDIKAQALESYNVEDLSQKVDSALASYPSDKDIGTAVGLIQSLTAQSGFIVTAISLGASSNSVTDAKSYGIKLDATGPGSLLNVLFTNIENSTRLLRISNIEVTNSSDRQSVTISMGLDALYSPLPNSFGSVDSPLPELSQKEQEVLTKLAGNITPALTSTNVILPSRGRANPFE